MYDVCQKHPKLEREAKEARDQSRKSSKEEKADSEKSAGLKCEKGKVKSSGNKGLWKKQKKKNILV